MRAFLDPDNLPAGEWVDCYRVVRRLGGGGQGTAYQVEKDGGFFTLKIARHRAQSVGDAHHTDGRMQRELSCMLNMSHPHIARVWAYGRWPNTRLGYFYLVMDYVEGCTLDEWQERHLVTAHEVVVVMEKVLGAVASMHAQGIYHRDLKPGNILVDTQGEPKVLDYGAASFPVAPQLTDQQLPPGTPRYTSPEAKQFEAEHRHNREARYEFKVADELFALGVTLYDLLTDAQPWSHPQPLPVDSQRYPPVRAREQNDRVPVALSEFAARLIAEKPEQRPVSVESARRSLAEFIPLTAEEWTKRPLHSPPPQAEAGPPLGDEAAPQPPWLALPPQAEVAIVPAASALAELLPASLPPPPRRRWARVSVASVALCMLVACGVYLAMHSGAPVPPPPVAVESPPQTSLVAGPVDRGAPPVLVSPQPLPTQEEVPPVKLANASKKPAPSPCSQTTPPPSATPQWRAWCKCASVVGTLVAFHAGCTGPQIRPASAPCPQEAIQAMDVLGLYFDGDRLPKVALDISKTADKDGGVNYTEGPLTGIVKKPMGKLVAGTHVFGEMRRGRDGLGTVHQLFRYTQVQLPDGSKWPVCLEYIGRDRRNWEVAAAERADEWHYEWGKM